MAQPPDDQPTERIPPRTPREPVEPVVHERVEPVGPTWHDEFAARLRNLQTAVALLTVLSLAALAVGIFALLENDDENGSNRTGASAARVASLSERVDRLESRSGNTASDNSVSGLSDSVDRLESRLDDLSDVDQSVESVQQDLTEIRERVDQLEQQQETP